MGQPIPFCALRFGASSILEGERDGKACLWSWYWLSSYSTLSQFVGGEGLYWWTTTDWRSSYGYVLANQGVLLRQSHSSTLIWIVKAMPPIYIVPPLNLWMMLASYRSLVCRMAVLATKMWRAVLRFAPGLAHSSCDIPPVPKRDCNRNIKKKCQQMIGSNHLHFQRKKNWRCWESNPNLKRLE